MKDPQQVVLTQQEKKRKVLPYSPDCFKEDESLRYYPEDPDFFSFVLTFDALWRSSRGDLEALSNHIYNHIGCDSSNVEFEILFLLAVAETGTAHLFKDRDLQRHIPALVSYSERIKDSFSSFYRSENVVPELSFCFVCREPNNPFIDVPEDQELPSEYYPVAIVSNFLENNKTFKELKDNLLFLPERREPYSVIQTLYTHLDYLSSSDDYDPDAEDNEELDDESDDAFS